MADLLLTSFVSNDGQARVAELIAAQGALKQMVLDSVTSPHTRRNYAKALDNLFLFSAGRPLTRALLQEWKASMDGLAPSTANVRLSAARRLVGEARKNDLIGAEEAAKLSDVPPAITRSTSGCCDTRGSKRKILRETMDLVRIHAGFAVRSRQMTQGFAWPSRLPEPVDQALPTEIVKDHLSFDKALLDKIPADKRLLV